MLEEKERGKSTDFSTVKRGLEHRIRICVGLDHVTPRCQWKVTAYVSSRAAAGAACTATWQLRPQTEASSEETWFHFAAHWEHRGWFHFSKKCQNKIHVFFFFFKMILCHWSHIVALCMAVWINIAIMILKYLSRKKWTFGFFVLYWQEMLRSDPLSFHIIGADIHEENICSFKYRR